MKYLIKIFLPKYLIKIFLPKYLIKIFSPKYLIKNYDFKWKISLIIVMNPAVLGLAALANNGSLPIIGLFGSLPNRPEIYETIVEPASPASFAPRHADAHYALLAFKKKMIWIIWLEIIWLKIIWLKISYQKIPLKNSCQNI